MIAPNLLHRHGATVHKKVHSSLKMFEQKPIHELSADFVKELGWGTHSGHGIREPSGLHLWKWKTFETSWTLRHWLSVHKFDWTENSLTESGDKNSRWPLWQSFRAALLRWKKPKHSNPSGLEGWVAKEKPLMGRSTLKKTCSCLGRQGCFWINYLCVHEIT